VARVCRDLADNRVFFQHPDLIRLLGIHETVMQLMVNTLNKAQQESAATESAMSAIDSTKRSSSLSQIPTEAAVPEPPKVYSCLHYWRRGEVRGDYCLSLNFSLLENLWSKIFSKIQNLRLEIFNLKAKFEILNNLISFVGHSIPSPTFLVHDAARLHAHSMLVIVYHFISTICANFSVLFV